MVSKAERFQGLYMRFPVKTSVFFFFILPPGSSRKNELNQVPLINEKEMTVDR